MVEFLVIVLLTVTRESVGNLWVQRAKAVANKSYTTTNKEADLNAMDPYKSSSFIGHSLWLVPSGESKQQLQDLIDEVASELGTRSFLPHVTLVAALMGPIEEILATTKSLASQLDPYDFYWWSDDDDTAIHDHPIGYRDAFFQCVFARLQKSETVMAANTLAKNAFPERLSDPPYMPHLSLVYGDLDELQKIDTVIPNIHQKVRQRQASTTTETLRVLPIDAIEVWSTQGDVSEWYLVERVPLRKNAPV